MTLPFVHIFHLSFPICHVEYEILMTLIIMGHANWTSKNCFPHFCWVFSFFFSFLVRCYLILLWVDVNIANNQILHKTNLVVDSFLVFPKTCFQSALKNP